MTWNGQLPTVVPPSLATTVPVRRTSYFSSETSLRLAGAGASSFSRLAVAADDLEAEARPPPLERTIRTLLSGTSCGPAGRSAARALAQWL